jgi:hypothetical protein
VVSFQLEEELKMKSNDPNENKKRATRRQGRNRWAGTRGGATVALRQSPAIFSQNKIKTMTKEELY